VAGVTGVAGNARITCVGGQMTWLYRLTRPEDGQDLLEYGLLASLIAVVALMAVQLMGNQINTTLWEYIARF
jgi:Flp pilus assembly pilin Flp